MISRRTLLLGAGASAAVALVPAVARAAQVIAFQVNKAGNPQSGFPGSDLYSYGLIDWYAAPYNVGSRWMADGRGGWGWQPVMAGETPKIVGFGGQLWFQSGATGNNYVAKVWRNRFPAIGQDGTDEQTAIGTPGPWAGTVVETVSMTLKANPGDFFTLWQNCASPSAIMNGDPRHTWWSGEVLGDA